MFDSLLLLVIGAVLGILGYNYLFSDKAHRTVLEPTLVLNKMRSVAKLVTVEGEFTNIMDYKDHRWFNAGPFTRKAIVKMNATVSVGYNLEDITMEAFPDEEKIVIGNIPAPEIIAIDSDLEYYDIQEGLFNSFGAEELTDLNRTTKRFLEYVVMYADYEPRSENERKIKESAEKMFGEAISGGRDLKAKAMEEGFQKLELIEFIAQASGWTVEYETSPFDPADIPPPTNMNIDSLLN